MTPKTTDNNNVFDVSKPGKSAPSPTSRPIITGHHLLPQDPMVSGGDSLKPDDKKSEQKTEKPDHVKHELRLEPNQEGSIAVAEQKTEETPKQPLSESQNSPAIAQDRKPTDESKPANDKIETPKPTLNNQLSEEELTRKKNIEKLAKEKNYFLPIAHTKKRRSTRQFLLTFTVVLVVGLIIIYLAVDAGLIKTNINLPFNIIKN